MYESQRLCMESLARQELEKMGFPVDENRVIISSHVAADYLNRNYAGKKVFLLGNERLTGDFEKAGINLVSEDPDIVVLGFDTTLTYQKMWDDLKARDPKLYDLVYHKHLPALSTWMPWKMRGQFMLYGYKALCKILKLG